ncbi:MAG: hypothetical protein HY542_07025 [Deltaproteobacteria bacterium]|nr:hypothetical protein [Deltaproteobacteria bacterium]
MSLNFCDVLVLGSDLSGVVAATLLAKRGMNVLVLDDDEDRDRFPPVITGLETRIFKGLMSKLMIPESKLQFFQQNRVSCQLILPRHRLDFTPDRDYFLKEVGREFPTDKEVVRDYLSELDRLGEKWLEPLFSLLPLSTRQDSKQFGQWLEKFPDEKAASLWEKMSPEMQDSLKLILGFLSRTPLVEPIHLQLLLYLSPENSATFSLKGGLRGIKKVFYEKLDYFGGLVHPLGSNEFKVLARGREVRGIKLSSLGYPTRCRFLIGNMNFQRFYDALPTTLWSYFAKKRAREIPLLPPSCPVQFEVARNFLPAPMQENLILVDDPKQPLEGLNYLEINLSSLPHGDEENLLLTASYLLSPSDHNADFFENLHATIEQRLRKLIPFAGENLRRVFPRLNSPEAHNPSLFPDDGDLASFLQTAQKRRGLPSSLFSPKCSTPFKNALSLGPNILPWMGTEGKVLAGLRGVELVWNQESKVKKN